MKLSHKLYLLIILVILAGVAYSLKINTNPLLPKQEASIENNKLTELKPLILDQKDLEGYYRVYKNPFVLYLRKALNAYLDNDRSSIATTAIEKDRLEDTIGGLDSFDKDYYKSKFIVSAINDSIGGGKDIQIIFQDKPDRAFNAWVYKLAGGEYELRSFYSVEGKEQIVKDIVEDYKQYIFDKEHAL